MLGAAVWFGAMAYSLAVVQPRAARFLGDERRSEGFAATLAAGARWKVIGLIAVLAASGIALVLLTGDRSGGWWALVVVKSVLLVAALALFANVSWRLWPARLFAPDSELPAVRRSFRRSAWALTAIVAAEIALGAAADVLA